MTDAIFDFDAIRRRRNQMLGLEPSGNVYDENRKLIVPDFSEVDLGRPLNWRIEQHMHTLFEKPGTIERLLSELLFGTGHIGEIGPWQTSPCPVPPRDLGGFKCNGDYRWPSDAP